MFRNSINEGFTLEEAMRNSRTTTPQDFLNAFGSREQWKKWGGGSKGGIRGKGHKSTGPTVSSIMSSRGLSPSFGTNIK